MADSDEVTVLLDRLSKGDVSPEVLQRLQALAKDPSRLPRLIEGMKALGIDQIAGDPLRPIVEYYVEKPGLFQLRWPVTDALLPMPFEELDRKTQFFVLFGEWTRREMEGMQVLMEGDTDTAEAVFRECLARAEQIEVGELVARSYEGLVRVAERRGRNGEALEWSRQAQAIRARQVP